VSRAEEKSPPDALAAVATVASPRLAPTGGTGPFGAFAGVFLAILLATNAAVGRLSLPDYGAWTGVIEIEQKLRMLEGFARTGPVDMLVLSSSLGDHGLSAAALSEELGRSRGRPWRVFNFSTGGADLTTCPLLYRLARTTARPREVMVVMPADPASPEKVFPASPEYFIVRAPVGVVIRRPLALLLSKWFWTAPLVRGAGPLRDYAVYRQFKSRTPSNSDLYAYSEQGDTLNYGVVTDWKGFAHAIVSRETVVGETPARYAQAASAVDRRRLFLSNRAVEALRELMALVRQDGGRVSLVAHDASAGYMSSNPLYRPGRKPYYLELSRATGLPVVDFLDEFQPLPHEIADSQHLNVHGARRFAAVLAARLDGRPDPEVPRREAPDPAGIAPGDPTFGAWSAVVVRDARDSSPTLEIRVVQSLQVSPVPIGSPMRVVLRQPDNSDLPLRAKVVESGRILAHAPRAATGSQVFIARIVSLKTGRAVPLPLASYRWSSEAYPVDSVGEHSAKLRADRETARPGQAIRASWRDLADAAPDDWIGLFREGGPDEAYSDPISTGGGSAGTVAFEVPAALEPGRYELRLFVGGGWKRRATSVPIDILTTELEPIGEPFRGGGMITASWREMASPAKNDWIGVFPAGQPDETRITFQFTGGGAAGTLQIKLPSDIPPGRYELRLFSRGVWERRAVSRPFHVGQAEPRR
jgi:hypothetical protein